jgi:hypothetical protein
MSNNVVHLSGWLEINHIPPMPPRRGQIDGPVIHASLYTDKPYFGGRHPVLIIGQPAQITLQWARESDPQAGLPQVVIQGKLVSHEGSSTVLVKVIHFLNSYDPTLNVMRLGLIQMYEQTTDEELRKRIWELIERAGGPPVIISPKKQGGDRIVPEL